MKCTTIITILLLAIPGILSAQINWFDHTIVEVFDGANSVYACDLDNDGDIDVLGTANADDDITWFENDGDENFTEHTIAGDFDGANSVYTCDLDDDGDLDVLGAARAADDIAWFENDGDENFTEHTIAGDFDGARYVFAVDLDNDDDLDVLGAANIADEIAWWENDGSENFTEHAIADSFDGANSVYACDLDGDGDVDILAAGRLMTDVIWFENDGSENFAAHVVNTTGHEGARSVYAVDVDNDGDIDILGAFDVTYSGKILWWTNDGSENFTEHIIDSYIDGYSVFALDLDDDGDVDVLGADYGFKEIVWFENDGDENFTKHTIAGNFDGAGSVYACDLDSDGDIDVLGTANMADEIAWWESDLKDIYDAGLVSIDIPSIVPEDTTFAPTATAKNFGSVTESFPITCRIEPGSYLKTQTVHDLAPGESLQVTFATSFTFASGTYTVTVYSRLTGDEDPANDTLVKVVATHDPGIAEDGLAGRFGFESPAITRGRLAIELSLVQATGVELLVYDVLGRQCQTLIDQPLGSGVHSFQLDLDLAAGIYFFHLKTGSGERVVQKFTLLR